MEIVRVPLLNANEDELVVTAVFVREGARVEAGQLIASVESTKTSMDVEAPIAGFVRRLGVAEDQRVPVGAVLCVVTGTADEQVELEERDEAPTAEGGPRATRRARELAEEHGIDLAQVKTRGIIKERDILRLLDDAPSGAAPLALESDRIAVYGAGGHARVIVDLLRESRRDLSIVGAFDDGDRPPAEVLGVPVLGGWAALEALREAGPAAAALGIGAVTDNASRARLFAKLRDAGFALPNLVHRRASVEPSVRMGRGNQIFAGAVVGSGARLGDNTIVNSGVVVSHDCEIGSHTHLTPGAILAGGVRVGENSVIGMGVTIYLGVRVGRDAVISNGVHVMADVPDGTVVRASAR